MSTFPVTCRRSVLAAGATLALLACGSDAPVSANGIPGRTITVAPGQYLTLTLQTVGPGQYASPPTISDPALKFIGVSLASPAIPAGPTQLFRFRAAAAGQAVVSFRHTGTNQAVEDTVVVR